MMNKPEKKSLPGFEFQAEITIDIIRQIENISLALTEKAAEKKCGKTFPQTSVCI